MAFHLATQYINNNMLLVEIYGEADVFAAPSLHDRFINIINAGNHKLIISLEKTTFIDSSGLAVLINAYKYAKKQDGRFLIMCSKVKLHQMLFMTAMSEIFPIANNIEEAYKIAGEWHSPVHFIADRDMRKFILLDNYITTASIILAPSNISLMLPQDCSLMA